MPKHSLESLTSQQIKIFWTYKAQLKQDDPLLATLFIIVIDDIFKQLEMRGNTSKLLKQYSAYANDI